MDHLYLVSGRENLFPPWGKEGAKEEKLREKGPGPQNLLLGHASHRPHFLIPGTIHTGQELVTLGRQRS